METRASKRRKQNLRKMETRTSKRRKQNLQQEEDNGSDRSLDDFPEDILKHILTFLPTVNAVRTSVLSRKWRKQQLWRSLPILHFNFSDSVPDSYDCTSFFKLVKETLKRRSTIPILKFHLQIKCFEYIPFLSKFDKGVSFAISHKVTHLNIYYPNYTFEFSLLENSHVRDVSLSYCDIYCDYMSLNLDSIRSMCLENVYLTDDMVAKLILWCKNLDSLVLKSCGGMNQLRICSSTLKKLSLEDREGSFLQDGEGSLVEICCPNLYSLCIFNITLKKFYVKDSLVEDEAKLCFWFEDLSDELHWWSEVIRVLTSVKRLTIQNFLFELLCKNVASLDGCVFENLNYLELVTGCGHCDLVGIAALLKICPNITTLTLDIYWSNCDYNDLVPRKLVDKPLIFYIPNLKVLNLKNSEDKNIEVLVELMKKHGAALEEIVVWEPNGKRSSIPL